MKLRKLISLSIAILLSSFVSIAIFAKSTTLQILATTDTHGTFMPYSYEENKEDMSGSLAQIATIVKELRTEYPNNTIVVDNGDTIQGNANDSFVEDGDSPMIAAFNAIGYDLVNLGNHEFNYGIPALQAVMDKFKAVDGQPDSVLCGNLYDKDGKRLFAPYKIVTTEDGVKVGFIGMVSPNIIGWDSENLKGYTATNPVTETKKIIAEIKDQVDILVAIDHMSQDSQYEEPGSGLIEIAEGCPELDLIIGGHSHNEISGNYYYDGKVYSQEEATKEVKDNGVLMIVPGCRGSVLGQVLIVLTEKDGKFVLSNKAEDISSKLIPIETEKDGEKEYVKPDPEVVKALKPYHNIALESGNKIIGELTGDEPLAPVNEVKGIAQRLLQPNAMIQLINKAQLYYADKMMDGKDVKVAASAFLRTDGNIEPGPIKRSDMALIYKYPNDLYVLEMNGAQLEQFMEYSAGLYNQYQPGDLTISFNPDFRTYLFCNFQGVDYDINVAKPVGERIENLTWSDGTPVKAEDKFLLATNNYMATSKLCKPGIIFKEGEAVPTIVAKSDDFGGMGTIQNLLAEYITNVKYGKINAEYTPNWKMVGNDWNPEHRELAVKLINEGEISVKDEYDRAPNSKPVTWTDVAKVLDETSDKK